MPPPPTRPPVNSRRVFATWWPLAFSWLLMGIEVPALSAVVARLAHPEIHLAAYGGVVYPVALIIESPIIMLLAASTALSKDQASYRLIRRFMMTAGALLTLLHVLVAFTPLYYRVAVGVLGVPPEIIEPARIGLMIMTPWTWSIAYRRFNQGVLIRFRRSWAVGAGTIVRLGANLAVLIAGYLYGQLPGIVVGASAVAVGVVSEAIFVGIVVRPVLNGELRHAPAVSPALTWKAFWAFYIPLMLTSLLTLLANPIGSAAISRMPAALPSLAVWPVLTGFVFMLRSLGIAFNEVVVALLDEPGSSPSLKRFAVWLSVIITLVMLAVSGTVLADLWFGQVSALAPGLAAMARLGMWLALPLPALNVLQSWYQGAILYGRRTRAISGSVIVYLLTSAVVLGAGVRWGQAPGLYIGMAALTLSMLTQTAWLWWGSRSILKRVAERDRPPTMLQAAAAAAGE